VGTVVPLRAALRVVVRALKVAGYVVCCRWLVGMLLVPVGVIG
jgi:hypothetical protein